VGPDGGARATLAVVHIDGTVDVDDIGRAATDAAGQVASTG
jgi:hypothetical protein